MYREQTEPDAGRTGTTNNRSDARTPAQSNWAIGGRGALAFAVMIAIAVGGYILMFVALDFLIKG